MFVEPKVFQRTVKTVGRDTKIIDCSIFFEKKKLEMEINNDFDMNPNRS